MQKLESLMEKALKKHTEIPNEKYYANVGTTVCKYRASLEMLHNEYCFENIQLGLASLESESFLA